MSKESASNQLLESYKKTYPNSKLTKERADEIIRIGSQVSKIGNDDIAVAYLIGLLDAKFSLEEAGGYLYGLQSNMAQQLQSVEKSIKATTINQVNTELANKVGLIDKEIGSMLQKILIDASKELSNVRKQSSDALDELNKQIFEAQQNTVNESKVHLASYDNFLKHLRHYLGEVKVAQTEIENFAGTAKSTITSLNELKVTTRETRETLKALNQTIKNVNEKADSRFSLLIGALFVSIALNMITYVQYYKKQNYWIEEVQRAVIKVEKITGVERKNN